ncbi:hypothetical protein L1887_22761 [Cichorium endivia]|nr:hypothetical protein L1887_22761 [Cichorium endivia]
MRRLLLCALKKKTRRTPLVSLSASPAPEPFLLPPGAPPAHAAASGRCTPPAHHCFSGARNCHSLFKSNGLTSN